MSNFIALATVVAFMGAFPFMAQSQAHAQSSSLPKLHPDTRSTSQPVKWACFEPGSLKKSVAKALNAQLSYTAESGAEVFSSDFTACLSQPLDKTRDIRLAYVLSPLACNTRGECYLLLLTSTKARGYEVVTSNTSAPLGHSTTVVSLTRVNGQLKVTAATGAVVNEFHLRNS